MSVVLTSPSVVAPNGVIDPAVVRALRGLAAEDITVGVISNGTRPPWFSSEFPDDSVVFVQRQGRQDGRIIAELSSDCGIPTYDFVVLGGTDDDVKMAKNGGGVLIMAAWCGSSRAAQYGIAVGSPKEFEEVVNLVSQWPGEWYFEGKEALYSVRALANVSGKNVTAGQAEWAGKLVATVKDGGPRLQALLTVVSRSLLKSGIVAGADLIFGLYPSSNSANADGEVLSDLTHRLRTTTSRVHFAKKGDPLLLRHTPSTKRSRSGVSNRSNPSEQIESLVVNPSYRDKVSGRHVVLLDDCTTYGVSFGVAASLLRAAGAIGVDCIALGKFGNQLRYYEIDLTSDPFSPIPSSGYTVRTLREFSGSSHQAAQTALRGLIR